MAKSGSGTAGTRLSFIIPALDEEKYIDKTLGLIKENVKDRYDFEVILVDNGSKDDTADIAEKNGAKVIRNVRGTIAALRNRGVSVSTGEIIVFIDADVHLVDGWGGELEGVLEELIDGSKVITGSVYGLDEDPSWIEKNWNGSRLEKKVVNCLPGGHMILTRRLYDETGGFNERLETGEDHEFCQRAKRSGAKIMNRADLKVVHKGCPDTLWEFFVKERWYGRGDWISLKAVLSSKPAILAVFQLAILIASVLTSVYFRNALYMLVYLVSLAVMSFMAGWYRCHKVRSRIVILTFLYAVYFIARTFSLFDVLLCSPSNRER